MREPPITINLPKRHSVLIQLDNGDQILVSNHDSNYAPAGEPWDRVRVLLEAAEYSPSVDVLYVSSEEREGTRPLTEEERVASQKDISEAQPGDRIKPPPGAPDFDEILLTKSEPYSLGLGLGLSPLDSILAAAVKPGLTPAEQIIRSPSAAYPAAPPAPSPAAAALSSGLDGGQEPFKAPAPPPSYAAMDSAPRDGEYVMLSSGDPSQPIAARWSSELGRQFWMDEVGDSLGFDNDFTGWRKPTEADREEFNLS